MSMAGCGGSQELMSDKNVWCLMWWCLISFAGTLRSQWDLTKKRVQFLQPQCPPWAWWLGKSRWESYCGDEIEDDWCLICFAGRCCIIAGFMRWQQMSDVGCLICFIGRYCNVNDCLRWQPAINLNATSNNSKSDIITSDIRHRLQTSDIYINISPTHSPVNQVILPLG